MRTMKVPGRILAWSSVVLVACMAGGSGAAASIGVGAPSQGISATTVSALPPGVIPRAEILARYASGRPGVTTEAKLVSLADLASASDGELTQCAFRGCQPGQLVWLVLEEGPPGSFPHSTPPGYHAPRGADAWVLFPVDATTGQARGDTEIGGLGQLASSPWRRLTDLDPVP